MPFFLILSPKLFVEFLAIDSWNVLGGNKKDLYRRRLLMTSVYRVNKWNINCSLFPPTSWPRTDPFSGPFKIDELSNTLQKHCYLLRSLRLKNWIWKNCIENHLSDVLEMKLDWQLCYAIEGTICRLSCGMSRQRMFADVWCVDRCCRRRGALWRRAPQETPPCRYRQRRWKSKAEPEGRLEQAPSAGARSTTARGRARGRHASSRWAPSHLGNKPTLY